MPCSGQVKQVCEELDISYFVLHGRWRESQDHGKNSLLGRGIPKFIDKQKEIALLKKQLKDISEEHEISKKIATANAPLLPIS